MVALDDGADDQVPDTAGEEAPEATPLQQPAEGVPPVSVSVGEIAAAADKLAAKSH